MEKTPEAAAPATPTGETETNLTTPTSEPTKGSEQPQAPDLHGFTEEQLADMRKFYDSVGGYEKVKSRISNPDKYAKPAEKPATTEPEQKKEEPTSQPMPTQEAPKTPAGAITAQEFIAEQYFKSLAGEEKYASISKGIQNGDYLKEMSAFGIQPLNPDGSINDQKVRMYLDLKSQTVPATPTSTEPSGSNAPTVSYTEVGGNGITSLEQAYKIIMESGNPNARVAEEYIRSQYNPESSKEK